MNIRLSVSLSCPGFKTLSLQSLVTIFSATVHQFSKQDLQGTDPTEMLATHGSIGEEVELTSKSFECGAKKLPGFDRTAKDDAGFLRRVTVLVTSPHIQYQEL